LKINIQLNNMKNIVKNKKIVLVSRFILGLIFIYASIDKIINPIEFSKTIDNYHFSPYYLNNIAALIIPWIELIIGLCLLFGVFLNGASFISILLLVFFIILLSQALYRGININCGCFDLNTSIDLNDYELKRKMIKRIIEDFLFLGLAFLINFNSKDKNYD
tara:strand:+ start:318 stop:803 length:486 start_codon:yes stop_codon:yes gene_type:complete